MCLGSNIKSIALFLNMASIFIPHFTESLSVAARYCQHARSHSHSDASCQTRRSSGSPAASEHKMQFLCHKPSVQAAGPEAKTTGCLLVSRLFLENKLGSADCRQPPWPLPGSPPLGLCGVLIITAHAGVLLQPHQPPEPRAAVPWPSSAAAWVRPL